MSELRFTPYAWAKLIYMRDKGSTEVAGYGISSIEDPLLVTDFILVKQESSAATFEFDDEGFADYVDDMIDFELQPAEFQRILIHTHPGNSATPSTVDEDNFENKFSDCDWAIMFILANGGHTTCALKYKNPKCRVELNTVIDFHEGFGESKHEEWDEEYERCVHKKVYVKAYKGSYKNNYADNFKKSFFGKKELPRKIKNPDKFINELNNGINCSNEDELDEIWDDDPDDVIDVFGRHGYNNGGMY